MLFLWVCFHTLGLLSEYKYGWGNPYPYELTAGVFYC